MSLEIPSNLKLEKRITIVLLLWGLLLYFLSVTHFYSAFPPQLMGLSVFIILTILFIFFFRNKAFQEFIMAIPLRYLTLFHLWRVFVGLIFLTNIELFPREFALNAGNGDILIGILSCVTFVFFQSKTGYIVFNIVGLLDLARALSLGLYYAFSNNQKMFTLTQLPFIYILLMGVPIWLFTHFTALYKVLKTGK